MVSRHVDLNVHKVWIDDGEKVATFPIINLPGQLVGYQQYRPLSDKKKKNHPRDGRYYTFTKKETRGVWGLESWHFSSTLFITEGIFDAARLTELGYSAIGIMSNDPKHLSDWLFIIRQQRHVVAICDWGKGGNKLKKYGHEYHVTPEEFDLGDAPENYVKKIITKYNGVYK